MENIENKVPNGENQDTQNSSFFSENVSSSNGLEVKFPRLRFNTFSSPWNTVTLQNLLCYSKGRCSVKKNFFISTENMLQNYAGVSYYEGKEMVSGVSFSKNDILLANIRPYLKKVWQAEFSGAASTDVLVFHPLKGYPTFIKYIIANDKFINYVMSAVKGSKMPRGDKVHIMSYLTAYPSLLEQQKIANFLSLIDQRIEKQRQLVESLKKYKRGALSRVFNDIENWEKVEAKDISTIETGCSNTQDNNPNGIYPFYVRSANIARSDKYIFDGEAVLTIGDGQIGKVYHYINGKFDCHQRVYMITRFKKVSGRYFYHFFSTFFYNRAVKMSAKNTVDSVRMDMIAKMPIYFPDKEKQEQILSTLHPVASYIDKQTKLLEQLHLLKKGLLQQMFI